MHHEFSGRINRRKIRPFGKKGQTPPDNAFAPVGRAGIFSAISHIIGRMEKRFAAALASAFALLALVSAASLCLGAVPMSPAELLQAAADADSGAGRILRLVRLPRTAAAILCGASLSMSGALIQTVLRNPLGSPNVLGMNAGSGLCVVAAAVIWTNPLVPAASAFVGAFGTLLLVAALGKKAGGRGALSRHSVLLAGVAANAFLTAISDGLNALLPDTVYSRSAFRIGSLAGVQAGPLAAAAAVIAVSAAFALLMSRPLDVLSLGDEPARSLGLNAGRTRFAALVLASLLSGAGVSFAGLVGFVGLIVPHTARILAGGGTARLLALSAVLGADLVALCDLVSRTAFAPYELPVGVMLSLLGGPFFFYLLVKNRKGRG